MEEVGSGPPGHGGHVSPPESFFPAGFPPEVVVNMNAQVPSHHNNVGSGALHEPSVWPNLFAHAYSGLNEYNSSAGFNGYNSAGH